MDYNPPITVEFVKKCKIYKDLFDFNAPLGENFSGFVKIVAGTKISGVKHISTNENGIVFECERPTDYGGGGFLLYFDVPKDSYKILT